MTDEWQFSAQIDEDGDLLLEWYKAKGNVVTVCFDSVAHVVNWAALVEGVSHHGCTGRSPMSKSESLHYRLLGT